MQKSPLTRQFLYFFSALLILSSAACKTACKEGDCLNGGVCGDSGCQCTNSYTGKNCETNVCKDVKCNNGTCIRGVCSCRPGYEGADCLTEVQTKFIGSYVTQSTCGGRGNCSIQKYGGTENAEILIGTIVDPFNYSHSLVGRVSNTSITVQSQYLNNSTIAEGSGQLNGTTVTLNMKYKRSGETNFTSCTYTLIK
jgi:hypothetical protein